MKTPSWEPSAGALAAFLAASLQAVPVDLYTVTLKSGTVLRYTSAQVPVTINAVTYAVGPALKRTTTKQSVGISVDALELDLYADATVQVAGMGIIASIALGYWDNAAVQVDHAFFNDSLQPQGVVPCFYGTVGQVDTERGWAHIAVRSSAQLLDIQIPGDLYQPGCKNTLYDAYCTVARASFTAASTVAGGLTPANNVLVAAASLPSASASIYDTGVLTFTSGPNAGVARTIKRTTQVVLGNSPALQFEFVSPFPSAMGVGDGFTVAQGCAKSMASCQGQFNNLLNFRGEPFIPAPETVT